MVGLVGLALAAPTGFCVPNLVCAQWILKTIKSADLTSQLTSQTSSESWRSDGENKSLGLQSGIAYEVEVIFTAKWQNGVQFLGSLDLFSLFD